MSMKTEIPGVNNAVQKLEELADRMRNESFGFKNNDVDNIDKVIDALYELETERKKLHDDFEKKSIKSCLLRHHYKSLPKHIREEVREAVMAARMSNASVLKDLQDKLRKMNALIADLEELIKKLQEENSLMQPEYQLLKQQHEEIIAQLNRRMSEKASAQIALNETRDKVQQTNQKIADLEDEILQLKEDLIQERNVARQEKKDLKQQTAEITQKTNEQIERNLAKKQELDIVESKLRDSERNCDFLKITINELETVQDELRTEETRLKVQLKVQVAENDRLKIVGTSLMNKRISAEREFKLKKDDHLDKIEKLKKKIEDEILRNKKLKEARIELLKDFQEKREENDVDAIRVAQLQAELEKLKALLNSKVEGIGHIKKEHADMSDDLQRLGSTHRTVVEQLSRMIEECQRQIATDSSERKDLQNVKESETNLLELLKIESQSFIAAMTSTAQADKVKHQELSQEGILLQKLVKSEDEEIGKLRSELDLARTSFEDMTYSYQKTTEELKERIIKFSSNVKERSEEVEILQQRVKQIEIICQQLRDYEEQGGVYPAAVSELEGEISSYLSMTSQERLVHRDIRRVESVCQKLREYGSDYPADLWRLGEQIDAFDIYLQMTRKERMSLERNELTKGWDPYAIFFSENMTRRQKTEISSLEAGEAKKKRMLSELTPQFLDLEEVFQHRSTKYAEAKKSLVDLKITKQTLEKDIQSMKQTKESLVAPQERLRVNLKQKRQDIIEQMTFQGIAMEETEREILTAACKLRAVMEENEKFEETCEKTVVDLSELRRQMAELERIKAQLMKEFEQLKDELIQSWEEDRMMQDQCNTRDKEMSEEFDILLAGTQKRENKLEWITERLKEELRIFDNFINSLTSWQPQESAMFTKLSSQPRQLRSRFSGESPSQSSGRSKLKKSTSGSDSDKEQQPNTSENCMKENLQPSEGTSSQTSVQESPVHSELSIEDPISVIPTAQ